VYYTKERNRRKIQTKKGRQNKAARNKNGKGRKES
jgi:hypothetical protein